MPMFRADPPKQSDRLNGSGIAPEKSHDFS